MAQCPLPAAGSSSAHGAKDAQPRRGFSHLYPRRRRDKVQPFNALKNNQRHEHASPQTSRTIRAVSIAGEGSWYRPKQAMGMEPSGAGWAWRSERGGRRGSEGSKACRGRWRDRRVDGAGKFKPACSRISRSRRRPLPGDLILPVRGGTSIGMKQALSRRPSRQTVPRSGRV